MTVNQESLHASVCTLLAKTPGAYEGDFHALWDALSIAAGTFSGRMIAWINSELGTSYTVLSQAQNAYAISLNRPNWTSLDGVVDADAASYFSRAGTLALARKFLISQLVAGIKTDLSLTNLSDGFDCFYLLANATATAALQNVAKNDHHCTAVASPTFTADTDYTFNGSTQYLRTDYIASTDAAALTGSNMGVHVYERTAVTADTDSLGVSTGTNNNILLRGRSAAGNMGLRLNSAFTNKTNASSQGMNAVTRSGSTFEYWKNGVSLGTASPASSSTTNTTMEAYISATNNNGTPAAFRAASIAFASIGNARSAAQMLAIYNRVQTYLTAIGAAV